MFSCYILQTNTHTHCGLARNLGQESIFVRIIKRHKGNGQILHLEMIHNHAQKGLSMGSSHSA